MFKHGEIITIIDKNHEYYGHPVRFAYYTTGKQAVGDVLEVNGQIIGTDTFEMHQLITSKDFAKAMKQLET